MMPESHQQSAAVIFASDGSVAEICDPLNGELIPVDDTDALIDMLARLEHLFGEMYVAKDAIRRALAAKTTGDAKTRRVQGKRRKARIEMPDRRWDQSILKEAWNSYPALRDQVLKIDEIGVKLTELKKLKQTAGEPDLEQFKQMVVGAEKPPTSLPTVKIEV